MGKSELCSQIAINHRSQKMIDKNEFNKIIVERKRIADETMDNWDYGIEQCHEKILAMITDNLQEGLSFLENECSPDDIYWISEMFDEIAAKTQSKEFIAAIHRIHDKMPEDIKKSIEIDIESAEQAMN